jgi:uncharacterized membrane protein YdjX (TVP38/TMEM64 family)
MEYLEKRDRLKIIILLTLLVVALIFFDNLSNIYLKAESILIDLGVFRGLLVFSSIMIFAIILTPIPSAPFAVIAGAVFGSWLGFFITLISATIGAVIAFLIGRHFLHDFFWKKFKKNKIYRKILESENKQVLRFIFISRIMPQTPFDIISYFSGITNIKTWKFALYTFIGMMPLVFILSFFGSYLERYRIVAVSLIIASSILYAIFKIIKYKRYYIKGY